MTQLFFLSPLEQFEVTSFAYAGLGGFHFALTNLGFYSLLVIFLAVGTHVIAANNRRLVPSRWSIGLESSYASIHGLVKEQIGSANEIYLPMIYAMFFFVLVSNLIGNVPYSFAVTTSAIVSMGLSLAIFLGVTILGLHRHGVHFFSYFIPAGTPLAMVPMLALVELISYTARAFSLGIRLFANMVAGHTLLKILSGFLYPMFTSGILLLLVSVFPIALFTVLIGLEVAFNGKNSYLTLPLPHRRCGRQQWFDSTTLYTLVWYTILRLRDDVMPPFSFALGVPLTSTPAWRRQAYLPASRCLHTSFDWPSSALTTSLNDPKHWSTLDGYNRFQHHLVTRHNSNPGLQQAIETRPV
ncbi:ATP synthase subunit 6 (mitochondrion) [Pseudohyphozyma bogoriensis]|nr:ATP synthase subunit 6 [Pseudohyphozyma bogoriensis]